MRNRTTQEVRRMLMSFEKRDLEVHKKLRQVVLEAGGMMPLKTLVEKFEQMYGFPPEFAMGEEAVRDAMASDFALRLRGVMVHLN